MTTLLESYSKGYEHGLNAKQAEVDRMSRRLGEVQAENRKLRDQNDDLRKQLDELVTLIRRHNAGEITLVSESA